MRRVRMNTFIAATTALGLSYVAFAQPPVKPTVPPTPKDTPVAPKRVDATAATAAGVRNFGFTLFKTLKNDPKQKEPVAISPLSIAEALTMATIGAEGDTQKELTALFLSSSVLKDGGATVTLTAGLSTLRAQLTDFAKRSNNAFIFTSTNSLWANNNAAIKFTFLPKYLEVAQKDFGAKLEARDFAKGPAVVKEINDWVKSKTENRIEDLLKEVKNDMVSILVNAIYAKGQFRNHFSHIEENDYRGADGKDQTVSFLHAKTTTPVLVTNEVTVVSLPVEDAATRDAKAQGQIALDIIVPKSGDIRAYADGLTGEKYAKLVQGLKGELVDLTIPAGRVKLKESVRLGEKLQAEPFNAKLPFDKDNADFKAMGTVVDKRNVYIGDVATKTFYEVTPFGFEAAAATAVLMQSATNVPEYKPVKIASPALHVVRHVPTGTPLFIIEYDSPVKYAEKDLVAFIEEGVKKKKYVSAKVDGGTMQLNYDEKSGAPQIAILDKDFKVVKVVKNLPEPKKDVLPVPPKKK